MSLSGSTPDKPLVIDNHFTTMPVNDRVLVYRGVTSDKQTLQTILSRFPAGFFANADPHQLLIGPAYAQPQAWVYLPLVNPTNRSRKMVLNLDHNRCDTLDAFLLRGHPQQVIHLGKLYRSMPLVRRAVPVRTFAVPFELAPHDRVGLLLHSRRTTGFHELSIGIAAEPYFTISHDREQTIQLLVISIAFFFTFAVCSLGLIFNHRLLVYFGVCAFTIALGLLNHNFFFDGFPFPLWLGLNANSTGLFIGFLANSLLCPFAVAYSKTLNLYRRWHARTVLFLMAANLIQLVLLLFPLTTLTNELVTRASPILTTLSIGWLFYMSIIGFVKKREAYLLLTATLVFVPVLYRTGLLATPALNYTYLEPLYYLLTLGFLTVSLVKTELLNRQRTGESIQLVQTGLAQLRKSELEQIGRSLHDQLGNTLASALGYLTMKKPRVVLAQKMILNAINESRVISHNLVKDDNRPVCEKLADMVEQFNDFSSICFSYSDFSDTVINQLPPLKQQGIYMIVQEVLHHVLQYSQTRQVIIQTFLYEGVARVSIEYHGTACTTTAQTCALTNPTINKRAELAKLTLVIDSGMGGISINIETPLVD